MKEVYIWEYTLRPLAALNSRSGMGDRKGVLIRVDDGFGCIHPWPELGDLPLKTQLDRLRLGEDTTLIRSAKDCAKLDREARRDGRSLFEFLGEPLIQPRNHWLGSEADDSAQIREDGFTKVKLKVGPSLYGVKETIKHWARHGFAVRLDANESVPFRSWIQWWMDLDSETRDAIEFVEDPCPWGRSQWKILQMIGIPMAADRDVGQRLFASDVAVYKPATDGSDSQIDSLDTRLVNWALRRDHRRIAVTSYMDHAIGQLWAAYAAGCLEMVFPDRMDEAGLLTHLRFDRDPFFEQLSYNDTRLVVPNGTGLGFDDLLEKLPWKRLT